MINIKRRISYIQKLILTALTINESMQKKAIMILLKQTKTNYHKPMIKFTKVVGNSLKLLEDHRLIKKQGNLLMVFFKSKTKEEIYEITPAGTKIFKSKVETTIKKFEKRFNILEDYYQIKNMKRSGLSQYLNETVKK